MFKIFLKNLVLMWLVLLTTNMLIFFAVIGFGLNPSIIQHLYFFNMLFWGLHFGSKAGKELKDLKDGQSGKTKDDKSDSE